jgi:hypothetical protein
MSPQNIIIEYFIHLRVLYEDLLSPYSFILDLDTFCTNLKVYNILDTEDFSMKFLHCVLMNEFIVDVSPTPSFIHINWN